MTDATDHSETKPKRIQRKRTAGFKMPPNTVYVGRPTEWGNPFVVGQSGTAAECVEKYRAKIASNLWSFPTKADIQRELRGKNLACWCRLVDQHGDYSPCHADVLLELANK